METDNISKKITSEFNEAGYQILRLHESWQKIEQAIDKGDLGYWKFKLDSIWRELIADVDRSDEKTELIRQNEKLKTNIAKSRTKQQLYDNLNARHEFLKILQDRSGKGGKYYDTSEDDFE